MKLNNQLAVVDTALAGARILRGTISAGYSHVIPSHPTAAMSVMFHFMNLVNSLAKQVLNKNKKTTSA